MWTVQRCVQRVVRNPRRCSASERYVSTHGLKVSIPLFSPSSSWLDGNINISSSDRQFLPQIPVEKTVDPQRIRNLCKHRWKRYGFHKRKDVKLHCNNSADIEPTVVLSTSNIFKKPPTQKCSIMPIILETRFHYPSTPSFQHKSASGIRRTGEIFDFISIRSFSSTTYESTSISKELDEERSNSISQNKKRTEWSSDTKSQPLYVVSKITCEGKVQFRSLSISEILRDSSMHARDLFSLALTSKNEHDASVSDDGNEIAPTIANRPGVDKPKKILKKRPPSVILPRKNEIIMSFGNTRALIGQESGIIFDAHKSSIQFLSNDLAKTFEAKMNRAKLCKEGENISVGRDYEVKIKYIGDPFELVFIEEILRDVCHTFNRRLSIYDPIVDSLLTRVSNEVFSGSGVHKLVPIKDSLQEFEMHVKSCLKCLTHLLENDEDMLGLLLTEQLDANNRGEALEYRRHESVELLFEEYARQLNNILEEINYMLRRVQSKQELVALSLDAYRNRMIRINVYLSIAGIGLATSTTVAGFYGMNLINGLENSPTAFNNIIMSTSIVGILLLTGCMSYISGASMQKRAMRRLDEIETINGALNDMAALDYAVKFMMDKDKPMNKAEFRRKLHECRDGGDLNEKEVDFLFGILDVSKDGFLYQDDLTIMENIDRN